MYVARELCWAGYSFAYFTYKASNLLYFALCLSNALCFAWKLSDMWGIDIEVMAHRLNILLKAKLVKQKKRVFGTEK